MRHAVVRVFVDARWFAQPGQGVHTYLSEIYSRLVKRDDRLRFVFGVVDDHLPDFLTRHCDVYRYPTDNVLWRYTSLGSSIKRFNSHVAHFQYLLPYGIDPKTYSMVTLHDLIFLDFPQYYSWSYRQTRRMLFGSSARRADRVLTISQFSADQILRHVALDPERLRVIPLGSGSRLMGTVPTGVPALSPMSYVLTVGRHEPRKNYARLVSGYREARLLEDHRIELVIAGWASGQLPFELENPPKGVRLLTSCSEGQLSWLYRNARGFVFPSVAEGYGLPLVEALEFGLPSIASDTYPISDILKHCISTFDPMRVDQIAKCLKEFVHNFQRRPVPELPSWDDHVESIYEEIMKGANATPVALN